MKSRSSSSRSLNETAPLASYKTREAAGELTFDEPQQAALRALDTLWHGLTEPEKNGFEKLLNFFTPEDKSHGIYLYGDVGRGKTMLMDLFYQSLPERIAKARWHFHAFMLQVHDYLHQAQKKGAAQAMDDVLIACADHYSKKLDVLCFDELVVRDVADAMLLSRLFGRMIENGTALVFTSNTAPANLYAGGWQRERFLPFISLITSRMDVIEVAGSKDFRTRHISAEDLYMDAKAPDTTSRLLADFEKLTGGQAGAPLTMLVKGHQVDVPKTAGRIAQFAFPDLCAKPLAAVDYLALCEKFDTFLLTDIPVLNDTQRNETKRFIALIDSLYDTRRRLIVSAHAEPKALYKGDDHAFEFERTASRLIEMRTKSYWDGERG